MRRLLVIFAISTVLLALTASSVVIAASDDSEGDAIAGVVFSAPSLGIATGTVSASPSSPDEFGRYYHKACADGMPGFDGVSNFECGTSGYKVQLISNSLTPCSLSGIVSCIESLEVQTLDGSWTQARYVGEPVSPQTIFPAFPQIDIGPSSTGSVYELNVAGNKQLILIRAPYFKNLITRTTPKYNIEISRVEAQDNVT